MSGDNDVARRLLGNVVFEDALMQRDIRREAKSRPVLHLILFWHQKKSSICCFV